MVLPVHVSNAEVHSGQDLENRWRSTRDHDLQRGRSTLVYRSFCRPGSVESAAAIDLQRDWRPGSSLYGGDDHHRIPNVMRLREMGRHQNKSESLWPAQLARALHGRDARATLRIALGLVIILALFTLSAAQKKSSCIE